MALSQPSRRPAVHYPESDGKPMAETDLHWAAIAELALLLAHRYRDRDDIYVASNNLLYFVEGDPRQCFSPDVYVVMGVPKGPRRTYRLWDEGRPPSVVFEITSRSTRREDTVTKKARCAALGVDEYFLFDPEAAYLKPPLQGFVLQGNHYQAIPMDSDAGLFSAALALRFKAEGATLAVFDSLSGERLMGPAEAMVERDDALRRASEAEAELARLRDRLEGR